MRKNGFAGIHDVARWMGQPFHKQYPKTSNKYLSFETDVMQEIVKSLKLHIHEDQHIVVDTTASVIYTSDAIIEALAHQTTIVYLDTPDSVKKEMYESYLANPKPVIWGKSFTKRKGETNMETLARCYPELLVYRAVRYKKYAHITLEYNFHRRSNFRLEQLLDVIHKNHSRHLM